MAMTTFPSWIEGFKKIFSNFGWINTTRGVTSVVLWLTFFDSCDYIIEYEGAIWDCQDQSLISKLENVQLEAVSGRTKFISLDRLYDEMGEIVKKEGKSQVDFIS